MTWWNGAAILFDLESDSPQPTEARIITACVAEIQPGELPVAHGMWLLKPERDIPQAAINVHHVTTEHAREFGEDRARCVESIALALSCAKPGEPVIGHNVGKYDLVLLDREMRRLGVGSLGTDGDLVTVRIDGRQVGAFHVIDTLVLDKAVDPYRKGSRKLVDVAAHYGVPIRGDAHTADADALAAGRIAWAIAKRCGGTLEELYEWYADRSSRSRTELIERFHAGRTLTLPELHRAQVGWAAEQARGLADYFRRTGTGDPDSVSGAWPLEPVNAEPAPGIVTVDTGGLL